MATSRSRSPEFVGAGLVIVGVVWFGLIFWVSTHSSGLRWLAFVIGTIVALVLIGAALARGDSSGPDLRSAATPDDGSWRVLIVVDDGGTSETFRRDVVETAGGRAAKAFVVAPALSSRLDRLTGDQAAYDDASTRLDSTLAALRAMGVDAQGRIGSADPLQATADGLRQFPADTIIFATHAEGAENWLEKGVVEAARSRTNIPVEHVVVGSD
jgi:hypothetical protein